MTRSFRRVIKQFFMPFTILLMIGGITYLPGHAPILYSDDWIFFGSLNVFGGLKLVDWNDRRPFQYTGFKMLLDAFGLNLKILYVVDALIITLCALVVFFIIRRLFARYQFLALPIAILFLIYPVDRTRMWLTQSYTWIICLETLLAIYFMLNFAQKGQKWSLLLALPLIILPLGAYEAQLGLVMASSLLLAVLIPKISIQRRVLLLLPALIGVAFVFWRAIYQPVILKVHDPYMDFSLNQAFFLELLHRLSLAFPTFINCWVQPFSYLLGISVRRWLFLLGGVIISSGLLAFWVSNENEASSFTDLQHPKSYISWAEKKAGVFCLLGYFILGTVLLLAGYVPAFVKFAPSIFDEISRINLFAIFGGAIALGSLIGLVTWIFAKNQYQMQVIVAAAIIPLMLSGISQQIWNQNEARMAWAEQKHFWHATFKALPDLENNTTLVVVMPYDPGNRPFKRLPVSNEWEVSSGLQVLYHNPTLRGIPYTPDHNDRFGFAKLEPGGVRNLSGEVTSYDQVVFVYFAPRSFDVQIIREPEKELRLPFPIRGYRPEQRIKPTPPALATFRFLVR